MQNPGWRAQRHRRGRRFYESRQVQKIFSAQGSAEFSRWRPPPPYGPDCCSKTAISDRAPLRRPLRRAQLRCCSAGYGAFSEKEPRPTVSGRTLGLFWSPAGISSRLCSRTTSEIPLKAGGRPVPLGTRKLESARQHATTALPRGAACPRWAGDAAHRWGLPGEKTGFVRALAEIDQTTKSCLIDFLLQQSRAVA